MNKSILEIQNYTLSFLINKNLVKAVDDVSLSINKGEFVALVGESGCGKSLTALSILSLLPQNTKKLEGQIIYDEKNLIDLDIKELNKIRGNEISMIFQEPMTALNPLIKVNKQITQAIKVHNQNEINYKEKIYKMLEMVGLEDVDRVYNSYPHQLSGGMRQRVMIAQALINNPSLLIADEPTTALDVTIQNQILKILKDMNTNLNNAVLFISHDLSLVKKFSDKIYVMYASMIVESASSSDIINNAKHPYTKALLKSLPSVEKKGSTLDSIEGVVPKLENRKNNMCPFAPRCKFAKEICFEKKPKLEKIENSFVRCHFAKELN
ncbi:MAG: ABC transporter ATP-binding protein [Pleomorphochaeta sp.]